MNDKTPFHLLKLRTGETLFVEFSKYETEVVSFINPLVIKTETKQTQYGAAEAVIGAPWVPFTDLKEHTIPVNMIYYAAPLSENYRKFYGNILMKVAMHDLHENAMERIEEGEQELDVLSDVFYKMEATNKFYTEKFNIEPFDLSMIKEKIEGRTKDTVLH